MKWFSFMVFTFALALGEKSFFKTLLEEFLTLGFFKPRFKFDTNRHVRPASEPTAENFSSFKKLYSRKLNDKFYSNNDEQNFLGTFGSLA